MNVYRGMKNLYSDVYYNFRNPESLQEGPLKSIPNDVLLLIFSRLSFEKILKLALVNKNWKIASDDPALLKYVIFRDKLINPDKFKLHLDHELGVFEAQKAWEALPNNIGEIFRGPSFFPNKKKGETCLIAWIPKNATINSIGKLLQGKFDNKNNDYHFIDPEILKEFGDQPIQESTWIAMEIDSRLKSSHCFRYCETVLDLQSGQYRKPKIVEAVICLSLIYFRLQKMRLTKAYCQENFNGHQVRVEFTVGYYGLTRSVTVFHGISIKQTHTHKIILI